MLQQAPSAKSCEYAIGKYEFERDVFKWRTHLCVLEVVAPERADLVLTSHIPHCEVDVLVLHRLNVES